MITYSLSIVGMGFVGLCTAVGFASKGYPVISCDINPEKVDLINRGVPPFYEPELSELLKKVVNKGLLKCKLGSEEAILNTDITFITVGTPSQSNGSIDLQYVISSIQDIGNALNKKKNYHLLVVKSTIVPGTSEKTVKPILEKTSSKKIGFDFGLCMNPEFLREGSAIHDTLYPDRIIIGEYDKISGDTLMKLYRDFFEEALPSIIRTNLSTAELIKYANNVFLTTKISFINQLANICQKISGVDVNTVAKGIGLDQRIQSFFLNAGLGYGGSCLPKDINALIALCRELHYDPVLLTAVEDVNKVQPYKAIELAKNLLGELENKRVAVLGLAFKPNTDDMRGAVSKKIICKLLEENAKVIVYDPVATSNAKKVFKDTIKYASSSIECINSTDCCIIVTEWEEFKHLKPDDFIKNMKSPIVIDGRRIFDPEEYSSKLKFEAIGLGKT